MKYIECPQVYRAGKQPALFLGGGITSCPAWQAHIVELLKDLPIVVLNPRRADFDVNDPGMEVAQITWEHRHMQKADAILFWFPCETLCPITLYELGKWVGSDKRLFIGHHPDYQRRNDLRIQVGLVRSKKQKIHDSLPAVAQEVQRWAKWS
jgi:hypothetical protein